MNPLLSFLAGFKAKKGDIITHTRIPDKSADIFGGSWHIPDESYEEFMKLYYDWVIEYKNDEYLTEKQQEMVAVDFDFRYDPKIKKRQHTPEHIIDVVDAFDFEMQHQE